MTTSNFTIDTLIDFINLSNNGYAIEEYMHYDWKPVIVTAIAEGKVKRTAGVIHLPDTVPFFVNIPCEPLHRKKATPITVSYPNHEPDYESAILSRQSKFWGI